MQSSEDKKSSGDKMHRDAPGCTGWAGWVLLNVFHVWEAAERAVVCNLATVCPLVFVLAITNCTFILACPRNSAFQNKALTRTTR